MEEWKECCLGDIVTLVIDYRGKTPLKLGGNWSSTGFRALSAKNIKTGHIVNEDSIRFVDEVLYKKWMKDEVQRGDIFVTSEAPFGQIYYWDSDEKIVLSQRLFCLRLSDKNCSRFVYYYMTTNTFQSELDGRATGTTVVGLRQPELLKCKIKLPALRMQQQIASVLSSLDDKIEINRRINENLEQQAQALFKSWFVDFEPFRNQPFVESELGMIPEGWSIYNLQDLVTIKRGGSPRPIQDYISDKGYRWLKISDATNSCSPYIFEIKEKIKESGLSKTVHLEKGSLVLSNSATPGIPKLLGVDTCIHDGWLYFPQSKLSKFFLFLFFKSKRDFLLSQGNGSVFTNLKTDIIRALKLALPPIYVFEEFNNITETMFNSIENNTEQIRTLSQIRDTLLPRLMSGELKVNEIEQ